MGKENGSGVFADSNWRGEKFKFCSVFWDASAFVWVSINKFLNRNLINISVIKINPLTVEPGVMWCYFDFELLRFVISN